MMRVQQPDLHHILPCFVGSKLYIGCRRVSWRQVRALLLLCRALHAVCCCTAAMSVGICDAYVASYRALMLNSWESLQSFASLVVC